MAADDQKNVFETVKWQDKRCLSKIFPGRRMTSLTKKSGMSLTGVVCCACRSALKQLEDKIPLMRLGKYDIPCPMHTADADANQLLS